MRIPLPGISDSGSDKELIAGSSGLEQSFWSSLARHSARIKNDWRPAIGAEFKSADFCGFSIKRVEADRCVFTNSDFTRAAGSGSMWRHCRFIDCDFSQANFQNSIFDGALIKKCKVAGTGFTGASFKETTFEGINIEGCTFSYADFSGANFKETAISATTFEDAYFAGTKLTGMDLSETNIEYVDLSDAKLDRVRVSLQQFPFIFGAGPKLIESGRLLVSTEAPEFSDRALSWDALLSLIPPLVHYYAINDNWFPVANLLFLSGEPERARRVISLGIRGSLLAGRYAELKHLCKLARQSGGYEEYELRELYASIVSIQASIRPGDYSFLLHNAEIRQYLTPYNADGCVVLSLVVDGMPPAEGLARILPIISNAMAVFGVGFSWECLSSHINSPHNIILIFGDRNLVRLAAPKTESDTYSKVMLALTALGALFTGLSWLHGVPDDKAAKMEALRAQTCQAVQVTSVTAIYNNQTMLYTLPNGKVVATLHLQQALPDNTSPFVQ